LWCDRGDGDLGGYVENAFLLRIRDGMYVRAILVVEDEDEAMPEMIESAGRMDMVRAVSKHR
jgi:hypothetical protein